MGDRYPTSRYSVFSVKSVSGQICGQKASAELHGGDAEHHLFIVARMRGNVKCEFADFLQKRGVGGGGSLYRSGSLQWRGECACGAERNNLTERGVRDIIQAGIGIGVARLVAMVQASVTWVRRRRDMGALRVGGGAETEGAHGRTGDLSDSQRCGGNSGGVCGDLRADCAADRARAECAAGGQGAFAGGAVRGVSLSSAAGWYRDGRRSGFCWRTRALRSAMRRT